MQKAIESQICDNSKTEPKFLTATEVANIFFNGKLKYTRVLRMTRSGELPAMKQGKSYIYLQSALENWAEENLNKPNLAHYKTSLRT